MNRNLTIAAAVASVLASGVSMAQVQPLPSAAQTPVAALYISGSSAAKNAVLASLEGTVCGGTYSLFSSTGDKNFFAVSCAPLATTGLAQANGANIYTIWYRAEGGSVTGVLPIISGSTINQMVLTGASDTSGVSLGVNATSYAVSVPGSSAKNGIDDSFASNVTKLPVQLGIADVEPSALVGDNYPSAYKSSVYGTATPTQLRALNNSATTVFDQVFGIFVNTNAAGFSAAEKAGQGTGVGSSTTLNASLNLPYQTIQNVLQGNATDWSDATDTAGNAVASTGTPIVIINREQGSGSRTATSIFFTNDECVSGVTSIQESTAGTADFFATGDALGAANTIPGAITYASIDNAGSFANLTLVAVNGVTPTNLAAAAGEYPDWYEATVIKAPGLVGDTALLANALINAFKAKATTPQASDVLALPTTANAPAFPISGTSVGTAPKNIYVNPFTRSKGSCNNPLQVI